MRRELHQWPELSGDEYQTARRITEALQPLNPSQILTRLGGTGVAAIFNGEGPGPTVMIRCELDGLPIEEISELPHRSQISGQGHLCGHDGHMAIAMGVARLIARYPVKYGRVVVLFQPAEETGAGAQAVIDDPAFAQIAPDYAFSLHNLPGLPIGQIQIRSGVMNCASQGMKISLVGKTSHASSPQDGISPMSAVSTLMPLLTDLCLGEIPDSYFTRVTVTHARMGAPTFGVAPGEAELWCTLRTVSDDAMKGLVDWAEKLVAETVAARGLECEISYADVFHACTNDVSAADILRQAVVNIGRQSYDQPHPMYWSEDFGRFGMAGAKSAMFVLGSGTDQPQLHNPDFDFPDDLIPIGVSVFTQAVRTICGTA